MFESKINERLQRIKNYDGSYAVNELKNVKLRQFPSFLIINLDDRQSEGSHWIALAIYLNNIFVCDSLGGINPNKNLPIELINFLDLISINRTICMTRQLQPKNSEKCGSYCILFINEMFQHNSFAQFLSIFTCDKIKNDEIISFLI